MKYIENQKYLYQAKTISFPVTFLSHEKDFAWFNCDHCNKEIKNIYFFEDENESNYALGSECVKKVIKVIKE